MIRCLGKKPPKIDHRTFKLSRYLAPTLPTPPASTNWRAKVGASWGMMLNDQIGDCGIAAPGHAVMGWTANNGTMVTPTDQQVLTEYEAVTGSEGAAFNPQTGLNDNGVAMLDVCNRWRSVGLFGHTIGAFAAVDLTDPTEVKQTVDLMGGMYLGIALPKMAQEYINAGKPWLAPTNHRALWGAWAPGSWGGHAVWAIDYDAEYLYLVTWGAIQPASWNFLSAYGDEGYACVAADWTGASGKAPSGFDAATLTADLAAL